MAQSSSLAVCSPWTQAFGRNQRFSFVSVNWPILAMGRLSTVPDNPNAVPTTETVPNLAKRVEGRFGVLPNFFRLAPETPEITAKLWGFAEAAYLDNPLPSVFKERLFVHLSRFCAVRYCIARHVGFLVGLGRPAGDPTVRTQSVEDVVKLLRRPFPRGQELQSRLSLCAACPAPIVEMPMPDTQMEDAIFVLAAHVFLTTSDYLLCLDALARLFGPARLQYLLLFLAFVRAAHHWTETHPEIALEDDINKLLATHEALADCIFNDPQVRDTVTQSLLDELPALRLQADKAIGLLAAIVDSSDDAIVSKTLDGIITSWNKSAERIFGFTAEEAIGQHITLIIPSDRHAEESDIIDRLRRGERIDHFHPLRRRKDGTLLDVSLTISPVRDSSGRVVGASKVARDITAQKQSEVALRESEQRFRVITDASPILVWMSGTDKLCYYFNKGWLDFVGRTLEQESGNGWAENVHSEDFDRCLQIYVSNFDARLPFEMEYRMRHHTGQYRWILDRGVPRYTPDGTFEGYVGGCLDIHDQKEAAEKIRIADDMTRLMKTQDEERRRIARELHDSAGQTLAVLSMGLAQLVHRVEGIAPELAREGKEIEAMVQQLHREIRTTSYLLHPPLLDESGLASALNWYVEGLADRSDIAITLEVADDVGKLPSDMELAIFRLVQECLTNIHRHSC